MKEIKTAYYNTKNYYSKNECMVDLAEFFETLGDVNIIDIEKEWKEDKCVADYKPNINLFAMFLYEEKEEMVEEKEKFGMDGDIIVYERYEKGEFLGLSIAKVLHHIVAEDANKIGLAGPKLQVQNEDGTIVDIAEYQVVGKLDWCRNF